jgi:formyl-CoA transferase
LVATLKKKLEDPMADNNKSSQAPVPGSTALAGIRVIDLTQFESGTSCTQTLAWLGAEVIKVEEPKGGDQSRAASTDEKGVDSVYFLLLNCNKQSVTCNLKSEEGREVLRDLIRNGDVFIENYSPGAIERLGFSYEEVKAINPRIIYAQIKGFASDSPYSKFLCFDMIAQSTGGLLSVTGEPDGMPQKSGQTVADTGSGLICSISILAALHQRHFTGEGQHIEIPMQDVMINFGRITYAAQAHFGKMGKAVPRSGNQSVLGANSPSNLYPCKGGGPNDYVFIYTSRAANHHWTRLLKLVGREDLIGNEKYASPEARYAVRHEVDEIISAWTVLNPKKEVMRIVGEAGVPVGAIYDTLELMTDRTIRSPNMFVTVKHAVRGDFTMPGWPAKMSKSKVEVTAAPVLGTHTEDVYSSLLGYSKERVAKLKASGAI